MPSAGALPANKDVIAAVNYEKDKSTKISKSDKEKEAINNVTNEITKKFHDVNPALPLFQEYCDVVKF